MQSFLVRTKLQIPPTRPGMLARQRLIQQLDRKTSTKLVLVSAPAGYGKTTLLSKWAADLGQPVAWFSIDEGDNDPVRFLFYLISAIQHVEQTLGQSALAMLQAPSVPLTGPAPAPEADPFEPVLAALIEDILRLPDPLVIVLDDYHLVRSEPVHQILRFLLEHQPEQMTFAVSTRHDPPLNLSRMRARDQMVEIRERDLSFTHTETTEFLKTLQLSPQIIRALETRTEGWAAGLQLAALSLKEYASDDAFIQAFSGDDRQIADYLFDEVLRHQTPDVRDFLLHTSVLDRLSGPLCDAVLGDTDLTKPSQDFLEQLDAAQLFLIPLDNKREWYRYHHLFVDFLRARLKKECPDRLAGLRRRASQWYEKAGDISTAVEHAFQVPDVERAAHLIEQHATIMVYTGQIATYLGWIGRIPQEIIFQRPYLCADSGWAFALSGQIDMAERFVLAGKQALPSMTPFYVALRGQVVTPDEVLGDLSSVQAFCARLRGDSARVMRYSEQALQQLPADAYTVRGVVALNLGLEYYGRWDWQAAQRAFEESYQMTLKARENIYVAIVALCMQASIHTHQGELDQATQLFQQAIDLGKSTESGIPATCLGYRGLAEIHYHRNELGQAVASLETALELARQTGNVDMQHNIFRLRAWLAIQAGDIGQAKKDSDQSKKFVQDLAIVENDPDIVILQTELLLSRERIQAAIDYLAEKDITPMALAQADATDTLPHIPEYLSLGRALMLAGQRDAALQLLGALSPIVKMGQDTAFTIQMHLLLSVLYDQKNNARRARETLERALDLAEPSRYLSPFFGVGQPLYELVRRMTLSGDLRSDYAQKVLAAFVGRTRKDRKLFSESDSGLVERLTRQETQVLRLLAQGLNSTQVAEELVIAVSTTRSYIKSIYQKLDVHSRDEALARAKHLVLI
ncbi:MAG: tetratricopeptide repeat protein [Chloroflexi bacterium]|nr:tetratricopeptide repeat protein [Chloroflexota bacterium]